jgi:LmbE family N-acetylglucosaminyl deacetylase
MRIRWPRLDVQHVYFSPHPDDVALSCGGAIWQHVQRGEKVAVVTMFVASPSPSYDLSPFAASLHEGWQASAPPGIDFTDPPAVRRAEDIRSFEVLASGIEVIHLPMADCIYRYHPHTGEPLYPTLDSIFGQVHSVDPARPYLEQVPPIPDGSMVYGPLAVGKHVDHQLARAMIEGWGLSEGRLRYYEDFPYVARPGALEQYLGDHSGWIPVLIPLDPAALDAKIAAVAEHASQIKSFWQSVDVMSDAVRAYTSLVGGERLWLNAGSP